MFERFTEKSRRALFFARYAATEMRSSVMEPEHLLEGVLEASPTSVSDAAATVEIIRKQLHSITMEQPERPTLHEIIFSPALKRVLTGAAASADGLGHRAIRPEHLLIAILEEEKSAAARALRYAGVDRSMLELKAGRGEDPIPEQKHATSPILFDVPIAATPARVFDGVSEPTLLDHWWTRKSTGARTLGHEYALDFGPGYIWKAVVKSCEAPRHFSLEMTDAADDWKGTVIDFRVEPHGARTMLHFAHHGWTSMDAHYRTTAFCWAMYLRILARHLVDGELVPFEKRLSV